MSRGGSGGRTRVKTARNRTAASTRWLERQLNDPYVRRARAEGYRSRAAYKLIELDERFGLLKGARRVIDLGIAPGGWTQVVRRQVPVASVVGIDLLPVDPIDGATILQLDFMDDTAPGLLQEALGGAADLVLSDMAANTVGHPQTDHLRTMALVEAGGLACFTVWKLRFSVATRSLSAPPASTLATKAPPGFSTSHANSTPASTSAIVRR